MVYKHNNIISNVNVKEDEEKHKKIKYDYNTVRKLVTENNVNNFVIRENKDDKIIDKKKKYNFDIY